MRSSEKYQNSYIAETVGTNISHFLARIGGTTGNIGQIDHFTLFSDLVGASRHPRFRGRKRVDEI